MATTRTRRPVPLGVPALIGVAGLAVVFGVGGQGWQLVVSAILAAVLVGVDAVRLARR